MDRFTLAFGIFVLSATLGLAQTPPYVKNPITTNTPAGMTNAVIGVLANTNSRLPQITVTNLNVKNTGFFDGAISAIGVVIGQSFTASDGYPFKTTGSYSMLSYQNSLYFYPNGAAFASSNALKFDASMNATFSGRISFRPITTVPITNAAEAMVYAKTNTGIVELYARGSDGVETQISPHADDAPETLYDRQPGIKEMIWREESPFVTNGMVSFINLRRMARITELNTRAILYLAGNNNSSMSNALVTLQQFSPAARQVLRTETFAEYNTRTTNNLTPLNWDTVEIQRQVAYDADRALLLQQFTWLSQTNAALIAAGNTNLVELPVVPPVKNIKRPKPVWMSL